MSQDIKRKGLHEVPTNFSTKIVQLRTLAFENILGLTICGYKFSIQYSVFSIRPLSLESEAILKCNSAS